MNHVRNEVQEWLQKARNDLLSVTDSAKNRIRAMLHNLRFYSSVSSGF